MVDQNLAVIGRQRILTAAKGFGFYLSPLAYLTGKLAIYESIK